jgi:hypothetical protein
MLKITFINKMANDLHKSCKEMAWVVKNGDCAAV